VISFRYHIASLVAVLLALGAGVALGAGPLQKDGTNTSATTSTAAASSSAADEQFAAFSDAFAASVTPNFTTGVLKGRAVTMLLLPGAPQAEVSALTSALALAGASLAGTVSVGEDLVSVSNKQLVDELGGQLEAAATKVTVDSGSGSYERIGTLLGYAIGTAAPAGDPIDEQGKGILAGLSTAGLISTDHDLLRRASLLLVVAGPPNKDDEAAQGTASIVLSLVKALDARSGGVVLAGPASAAGPSGVLTPVRGDVTAAKLVSTVDTADHPAGAIVTVLAMVEQAAKGAGQYGGGPGAIGPRPGALVAGE
jgi:hypothetical protein